MKLYRCEGFDASLRQVSHRLEASDLRDALARSRRLDMTVTRIALDWSSLAQLELSPQRPPDTALASFCRQLSAMLAAGMPLVRSLQTLSEVTDGRTLKRLALECATAIQEGSSLSQALSRQVSLLPPVMRQMVAAAEESGRLPEMLETLAEQFDQEAAIRRKLIAAVIYPAVVAVLAVAAQLFFLLYLIPQFTQVYQMMGGRLPASTQLLIGLSGAVRAYGWMLPPALAAALLLGAAAFRRIGRVRQYCGLLALKLPVLGPLSAKRQAARFIRTFGGLYGSGVPIIRALELAEGSLTNPLLADVARLATDHVLAGQPLAPVLRQSRRFPPVVVEMIAVGEETGTLERMVLRAAARCETEVEATLDGLTRVLEPLLILLLTVSIGAVLIPTILPVLQLSSQLQMMP